MNKKLILDRVERMPTGCWEWRRTVTNNGYGQIAVRRRRYRPHRIALHLWTGFDLNSELLVCHKCDNKLCCNPKHLFAATQSENMVDCRDKGRLKGEFKQGFDLRRFRKKNRNKIKRKMRNQNASTQ